MRLRVLPLAIALGSSAWAAPSYDILLSVDADGTSLPGPFTVDNEDVIVFDASGAEPLGTDGLYRNGDLFLDTSLFNSVSSNIDGLDYIERDITLNFQPSTNPNNPPGGFVPAGSVLVSFDVNGVALPRPSGVLTNLFDDEDIAVFIPTTPGDLSAGKWYYFLDGADTGVGIGTGPEGDIDAFAFVERTVTRGGVTFETGDLLLSFEGVNPGPSLNGRPEDVFLFEPTSYGVTSAGTIGSNPIFRGSFEGFTTPSPNEDIEGIEFVDQDCEIGGVALTAGDLLLVTAAATASIGSPEDIQPANQDVFRFSPVQYGTLANTFKVAGSFSYLLDGSVAAMGLSSSVVDAIAFAPSPAFDSSQVTAVDANGGDLMPGDVISYSLILANDEARRATDVDVQEAIPGDTENLGNISGVLPGENFSTTTQLDLRGLTVGASASREITWEVALSPSAPQAVPISMNVQIGPAAEGGQGTVQTSNNLFTIPAELSVFTAD